MSKTNKPTQFYATVSTSIVLILVSIFLLIFLHSGNITNIVKQNINILIDLTWTISFRAYRSIIVVVVMPVMEVIQIIDPTFDRFPFAYFWLSLQHDQS